MWCGNIPDGVQADLAIQENGLLSEGELEGIRVVEAVPDAVRCHRPEEVTSDVESHTVSFHLTCAETADVDPRDEALSETSCEISSELLVLHGLEHELGIVAGCDGGIQLDGLVRAGPTKDSIDIR